MGCLGRRGPSGAFEAWLTGTYAGGSLKRPPSGGGAERAGAPARGGGPGGLPRSPWFWALALACVAGPALQVAAIHSLSLPARHVITTCFALSSLGCAATWWLARLAAPRFLR